MLGIMDYLQEITVSCPWCGEPFSVLLDLSVPHQNYVEDCQVCCCPIVFDVTAQFEDDAVVIVSREGE
jgi:hypothetical protein